MVCRRARVRKCGITDRWEVTHTKGWTIREFITTKRFDSWTEAYSYAYRWTHQGCNQSDYTLARGGGAS